GEEVARREPPVAVNDRAEVPRRSRVRSIQQLLKSIDLVLRLVHAPLHSSSIVSVSHPTTMFHVKRRRRDRSRYPQARVSSPGFAATTSAMQFRVFTRIAASRATHAGSTGQELSTGDTSSVETMRAPQNHRCRRKSEQRRLDGSALALEQRTLDVEAPGESAEGPIRAQ